MTNPMEEALNTGNRTEEQGVVSKEQGFQELSVTELCDKVDELYQTVEAHDKTLPFSENSITESDLLLKELLERLEVFRPYQKRGQGIKTIDRQELEIIKETFDFAELALEGLQRARKGLELDENLKEIKNVKKLAFAYGTVSETQKLIKIKQAQ